MKQSVFIDKFMISLLIRLKLMITIDKFRLVRF